MSVAKNLSANCSKLEKWTKSYVLSCPTSSILIETYSNVKLTMFYDSLLMKPFRLNKKKMQPYVGETLLQSTPILRGINSYPIS